MRVLTLMSDSAPMSLQAAPARYADERYAAQRRAGFPWLRFTPDLEEEYRDNYLTINAARMRAAAFLGLFGMFGFIILDQFLGSNLLPASGDFVLLFVTIPAAAIPVLLTFRRNSTRYVLPLIFFGTLVAALSILAVINVGRATNDWFPYESLFLVVIYIYFVSGLTFRQSIVAGALLAAAFIGTNYELRDHAKLLYEGFYLLLANLIGAIGHYLLERQSRMTFLLTNELRQQAVLDPLTGLMNRRAFSARLETVWRQAKRSLKPVGILVLDLDDFKQVNDTCGHQFGDGALMYVASVLRNCAARPLDAAARYGGDEFIALWYDVDGAWFAKLMEELPRRIAADDCGTPEQPLKVSASGGAVLAWPRPDIETRHAIKAADDLLYEMKRTRRGTIGHKVFNVAQDATSAAA
jgi:diguanylate cyclase (GGDEF)-like protein